MAAVLADFFWDSPFGGDSVDGHTAVWFLAREYDGSAVSRDFRALFTGWVVGEGPFAAFVELEAVIDTALLAAGDYRARLDGRWHTSSRRRRSSRSFRA